MSLGIIIKGPEGLVLASESRVTLAAQLPNQQVHMNFDNAVKLLSFSPPNNTVGAVTYGQAAISLRTAHSFMPEFEAKLPSERLPVQEFARRLSDFFIQQWQTSVAETYVGPSMAFVVGGFNEGEPYGRVFQIDIPNRPEPVEQQPKPGDFGITWGGQRELVDRLIQGFDYRLPDIVTKTLDLQPEQTQAVTQALGTLRMSIPLAAMPLQDCVDLAIFFIRTTITAQRLTLGISGCGGPIDVAIITRREGLRFIQRKQIVGEIGSVTLQDSSHGG